MESVGLSHEVAQDRDQWKLKISGNRRGVATGPVGPVSTGPLFGQLKIFYFARMKIITIDCKITASALYIT